MATFDVEGYESKTVNLEGWDARIASYRLGDRWACKIDNVSPGAVIARGEGATREAAEAEAIALASKRLRLTKRIDVLATQVATLAAEVDRLREDS